MNEGRTIVLDEDAERRLWRKIAFRIIPLVGIAYVISYIDRANLGYIAKPMSADLGMTTAQLGFAAGLFFLGYVLVEVPSNMMLRRFGARIWISRIIISWGMVTAVTGAVQSATQLYIARVILGFAEAVKRRVRVPVIAVGRFGNPSTAISVVEEGRVDFIALGRPLLADPD